MLRRCIYVLLLTLVAATLCSAQKAKGPATPAATEAVIAAAGAGGKKPDPAAAAVAADPTPIKDENVTPAEDEEAAAAADTAATGTKPATGAAGGAKKPDPALQACRKAAKDLKGEILLNEVFAVKVVRAWDLQDPSTSPLLKEVMDEYGVTDFQATPWRKDLQGNVRRRITYQVELAGFSLAITERNLVLPETTKGKCYSVLRTITVKGTSGGTTKLPVGQNVKVEVNSMLFSTPDVAKTRAIVALRMSGLSDLEQSLYDSIGKEKIAEVIKSVKAKLEEAIANDEEAAAR